MNAMPVRGTTPRRETLRARAGLGERDRLVLMTTASWQVVPAQVHPYNVRIATLVPPLIFEYLARLDDTVRVVHVGPTPLPGAEAFPRYQYRPPLQPAAFQELLASADLVLSLNVTATTIWSSFRHDVPALAVVNSASGETAEELRAGLARPPSPFLARHLEALAPLHRFRIWPSGLHAFLAPVLAGNPYVDAIDVVELLDETGFVDRCQRLLFDPATRADAAARRAAYVARIERLPRPAEAFEQLMPAACVR
jgi:hypothetical protein